MAEEASRPSEAALHPDLNMKEDCDEGEACETLLQERSNNDDVEDWIHVTHDEVKFACKSCYCPNDQCK